MFVAALATSCQQTQPLLASGCVTGQREVGTSADHLPDEAISLLAETLAAPANGHHTPPPAAPTAPPDPAPARKPRRRHLVLDISIVVGVFVVYVLSLVGYHWLTTAPGPLPEPDVNTSDGTVVLMRFEQLHTVANRLDVKVLVLPDDSMINKRLNVLNTDTSVRIFPQNDLGDLQYPVGKLPAQVATTIEAHGDPSDWPFDSYKTDTVQADVLVGSGENRQLKPGRVEVTGKLDGWDISATR